MRTLSAAAGIALALTGSAISAQADIERARRNYEQILHGQKQLGELPSHEQAEVAELDRALRGRTLDKRTPRQRCFDEEIKQAGASPSYLERKIIDLKCSQR